MTERFATALLVGAVFCIGGTFAPVYARAVASAGDAQAEEEIEDDNDIIVTARRIDESIQDVPQSMQAVTSETIEKRNLFQFEDISKVVSGLTLAKTGTTGGTSTIRGVSFNATIQTTPTVALYLNDAPLQGTFIFNSIFDVGQVEVLRGPQGTFRGQSAPSGAITITTRRPDLDSFGASASAAISNRAGRNAQATANLPLIDGVLAVRFAALYDRNNNGGVHSVNDGADPFAETTAIRGSVTAEPIDGLEINVAYQNLYYKSLGFGSAVFGNGAPGITIKNAGYAVAFTQRPGYNGPVLTQDDRLAVTQSGDTSKGRYKILSLQGDYSFLGQKLSYVGAYAKSRTRSPFVSADKGNLVEGEFPGTAITGKYSSWSHEVRLSSDERIVDIFDYVAGAFYKREHSISNVFAAVSFQPGAFGTPTGAPMPLAPNLAFSTATLNDLDTRNKELSFFGNVTAHVGPDTEISGGVRRITAKRNAHRVNSQTAGFQARVLADAACTAAGGTQNRTYTGVCDVPFASRITGIIDDVFTKHATVYTISASHHFTPDLMVYATTGTSFRTAPSQGGLVNGRNDPLLASFSSLGNEKSKSYEGGLKSTFFDGRLTVNVAYYHQKFNNLALAVPGSVPYLADTVVAAPSVNIAPGLTTNVDAKVDGIDVEISGRPIERLSLAANLSWTDGRYSNELIPCQDGNFDGVADATTPTVAQFQAQGIFMAQCLLSAATSQVPKWNATFNADYTHPLTNNLEAFIGGNLSYRPKNPNSSLTYVVPSYVLLDMQLGLRDNEAGWEFQLFARNLTNSRTITAIGTTTTLSGGAAGFFGDTGYRTYARLSQRELGIRFRYGFGSR